MLIIIDRSGVSEPVWGLSIPHRCYGDMTLGEYREAQIRRLIEDMGIPAAMFRDAATFSGTTTGRATCATPNMSAGSVRND